MTHAPPSGSVALGNMSQVTTHFPGLRPDQVREFQYQVRAYQWAEFSNVSLSPAHQTVVIVEPIAAGPGQGGADVAIAPSQAALRLESAQRLAGLGRALLIWANDHDGRLPDDMSYLVRDVEMGDPPLSWSEELGIRYEAKPKSVEELRQEAETQSRVAVLSRLKELALAGIMYASDHDGAFADGLDALKPYLRNESIIIWAQQNAEYVGAGAKEGVGNPAHMPLIYWKNPPATMDGTAVAFLGGHVEIVTKTRLEGLSIEIQPGRAR